MLPNREEMKHPFFFKRERSGSIYEKVHNAEVGLKIKRIEKSRENLLTSPASIAKVCAWWQLFPTTTAEFFLHAWCTVGRAGWNCCSLAGIYAFHLLDGLLLQYENLIVSQSFSLEELLDHAIRRALVLEQLDVLYDRLLINSNLR